MKSYYPKRDQRVKAVQFFRSEIKNLPKSLVQKVWAEKWGDCFVRQKRHRSKNKEYSEQYVIKDCNQYLDDGDWIIIDENGKGYARIERDDLFQITYKELP